MVESLTDFPFRKLLYDKYLTIDVMLYIEHQEAYNFMFAVNKSARIFLQNNFIAVRNGFINDGLITYYFGKQVNHYYELEKLYF